MTYNQKLRSLKLFVHQTIFSHGIIFDQWLPWIFENYSDKKDQVFRRAKRIMTHLSNADNQGSYVWRLVGFVNARGVCIFAIIVALIFPPLALAISTFSMKFGTLVQSVSIGDAIVYYFFSFVIIVILYVGIPKIRNQMNIFNELIISNQATLLSTLLTSTENATSSAAKGSAGSSTT